MRCSKRAAYTKMLHDIPKWILPREVHSAGVALLLEPLLRQLPGLEGVAKARGGVMGDRVGAREDILMVLRSALTIVAVSVVHPPSANTQSAAVATLGTVAVRRDALKRARYSRVEPNGYPFIPFTIESYGHLGVPAMTLLHDLGNEAASPGTSCTRASFVAGTLRELSAGLCRFNCAMYRASTVFRAHVTGRPFHTGMVSPSEEVV
jgi:hypothetical protein